VTLTEVLEGWVEDAERMNNSPFLGAVVTEELFASLAEEQACESPTVAGRPVLVGAADGPPGGDLPALSEMVEVAGPDRVSLYVGVEPGASTYPLGLDPAMPVVFVPVPPASLDERAHLEMYNRLRWYGLGPDEALAGSQQ
jgi:hypothetical protein